MRRRKERQKNKATSYDNSMALERVLPSRITDIRMARAIAFFSSQAYREAILVKLQPSINYILCIHPHIERDRQIERYKEP